MQRFCLFLLLFAFSFCLFAQRDSISDQRIDEVRITAKAKPSAFKSGTLLQVQTNDDFERIGVQSVSDAVRRFAGVDVKDYGGIGGLKTVSIRGLGSQHTAVSYDGITVSEAQSGQVDIGRFSLDNISVLSMSIGQPDDIFQSARHTASAGILNIKTTTPVFIGDKKYQAKVTVRTGSFGLFNPSAFYAKEITDRWSVTANAGWQRADGTYSFKYNSGGSEEKRKRYNSDVDIWNTELNVFGKLKKAGSINIKANYFDSERGLPAQTINDNKYAAGRLWDKNFLGQANYENKINDKISVQGLAKFTRNHNKYIDQNINLGEHEKGSRTDKYTQYEYYVSGIMLYKPLNILSLSLAQDYFHNNLDIESVTSISSTPTEKTANRNTWLTSANMQFKTSALTVTGSILATYMGGHQSEGNNPDDLKRLSPSVSVSYKPFDFDLRVRASYKDIFRVPTFNDVYYTQVGSRALKPEKSKQYNLGTTWICGPVSFLDYLSVSLDGYINKVKDKIVIKTGSNAYYMSVVNMGEVTIKGLDVTFNSQSVLSKEISLLLNGSYSYQHAKDSDTKMVPAYTPEHSGNMSVSIENPWLNISYSVVACGRRYYEIYAESRYRVDSFFDHSVSVNKSLKWGENSVLRLQGELLNIGGKNYEVIKGYPMPGSAFRLSVTLIF